MKLEVGDYVRTKNGIIFKYYPCRNNEYDEELNIYSEWDDDGRNYDCYTIANASYKIIDLIEIGDYVNGYKIDYINLNCETPFLRSNQPYRVDNTLYSTLIEKGKNYNQPLHFFEEDIKSIVTKEQFENMTYEVEE